MKYEEIKEITKNLRKEMTHAEKRLWKYLRRKQLNGRKFLRQHAIIYESVESDHFFFVPDFYCHSEKLAIELDGKIHHFNKTKDKNRDETLSNLGIKVLRFRNEELNNIENVLTRIKIEFEN